MPTEYQDIQQNNYSEKSYLEKTVKIELSVANFNMAENILKYTLKIIFIVKRRRKR